MVRSHTDMRRCLNGPLVSVIIPVYNVEDFLRECLNSVLTQTYDNLEVILIDDGSTDLSGYICDEFKQIYPNITVLHQSNSGLSGARNSGLSLAGGEYVIFIDSDDFINKDCIRNAVFSATSTNADMVLFKYTLIDEDGKELRRSDVEPKFPICLTTGENACKLLFERKFENYTWRQLTRTRVYKENNVLFPINKAFEDRYTTYKILFYSNKVFFLNEQLYNYRQRKSSIVHSRESQYLLDDLHALKQRMIFVDRNIPSLSSVCLSNAYSSYIGIFRSSLSFDHRDPKVREVKTVILNDINIFNALLMPNMPFEKKIQLLLIKSKLMLFFLPVINFLRKIAGHSY